MIWLPVTYALLLGVSAVVLIALVGYVIRQRPTPRGIAGVVLLLASATWVLGIAMEMASHSLLAKVLWHKLQYVGVAILPVAWIMYALLYVGHGLRSARRALILLGVIPLFFLVLVFTNEAHGLVWRRIWQTTDMPFALLGAERSTGLWVFAAYAYALFLLGGFLLARVLVRTHRLYRWQAALEV